MPRKPLTLPASLLRLYGALCRDQDVAIMRLYDVMFERDETLRDGDTQRNAQQDLGPYITKLNRRLKGHGEVVRPGLLKGTYRLQAVK